MHSLLPRSILLLGLAAMTSLPLASAPAEPAPLWPNGAPGALGAEPKDIPTLTRYAPADGTANGATILVLPGGGYQFLAEHEGKGYAEWLAGRGVTAYVLQYRLGSAGYRHPAMLHDAARALRTLRARARAEGLDPARIGVIGSSAGGHLASTLLTHFDAGQADSADPVERESSRPDLGILCYPVITMGEFTHGGSKYFLLDHTPSAELVRLLSNETQVTADTPPCFLWHTVEDQAVPVENSLHFAAALRRAGVPFELHLYEKGGHGIGLSWPGGPAEDWPEVCLAWLKGRRFLESPTPPPTPAPASAPSQPTAS
jgi:acetyl esterase/lipase